MYTLGSHLFDFKWFLEGNITQGSRLTCVLGEQGDGGPTEYVWPVKSVVVLDQIGTSHPPPRIGIPVISGTDVGDLVLKRGLLLATRQTIKNWHGNKEYGHPLSWALGMESDPSHPNGSNPHSLTHKMAGVGVVCVVFFVLCAVMPSLATDYTVGDSTGWTMGADYSTWTSGKTFVVGDTLVFNYGGGHTVDEVSASDYSTCTVGNAITSDSTGATTISLKKTGTHYFICGVIGHCGSGMKLAVTVESGKTTAPPTSSSATPSSGAATTSPATPTATTTTTPSSTVAHSSAGNAFSPFVAVVITWLALFLLVLS
ncbi:Blue copper protein [Vitis vinifera]|uniref:Blue copper protein n=1 Tax=Vitis vinifera TaxID=29760 RepID=A0A438FZK7_VITVI|nr:Blue copper protein [Vitis vinifera]